LEQLNEIVFVLAADRNVQVPEDLAFKDVLQLIHFHKERAKNEEEIRRKIEQQRGRR
jgi:hypothetical protein